MNPLQKRILEVLTEDVTKWEKAADDVEVMLPKLPVPDREGWKETAEKYRARAKEYKSLVQQLKAQGEKLA